MIKALIVDDEMRTINGILNNIDWESHNIDNVRYAKNGSAALEAVAEMPVNLVITDINMPKMDGFEFVHRLCDLHPDVKIIFVSGHNDIDYVRTAIKCAAVDYIFKPIDLKELDNAIAKSVESLIVESERLKYLQEIEHKVYVNLPVLQDKFINKLLTKDSWSEFSIEEEMQKIELLLPLSCDYIALTLIVNNFKYEDMWRNHHLFSTAVMNILNELIETSNNCYTIENDDGEFVCILPLQQEEINPCIIEGDINFAENLETLCTTISEQLKEILGIEISMGVGSRVKGLNQLHKSYTSAKEALSRRFFSTDSQILFSETDDASTDNFVSIDFHQYNKIYSHTINEESSLVVAIIKDIFNNIHNTVSPNQSQVVVICHQIASTINSALLQIRSMDVVKAEQLLAFYETIQSCTNVSTLEKLITEYAIKNIGNTAEDDLPQHDELINKIKVYIEQNYMQQISLNSLAGEAYICPSYLCLLFKQKTGQTITNYITSKRIENAKTMLRHCDKKLIDICFEVGFNDSKYFSRIFKKHAGCTPSEYRERGDAVSN